MTLTADPSDGTHRHGVHSAPDAIFTPTCSTWFACRVRSRREFRVRDQLTDAGIEWFLPTWTEEVRWTDRSNSTVRPLFTGYIFIRTEPGALHLARRIAGVVQVLGYTPGDAAAVSDREIASLRIAVASRQPLAECPYVAGERVRVQTGPLAGTTGVVTRSKGATRIVIAIELLRRAVSVEIDAKDLAKA